MGIFGVFRKVLPWKKKDDLALGDNLGLGGFGAPGAGGMQGAGFGSGMPGMPYDQQFGGVGSMGGLPPYPQGQPLGGFQGGAPQAEAFQRNQDYERSYAAGKEIEIVSAKLDAIKSALETLNQRLGAIERYIQTEQDFKKRGGW